MKNLDVVKLYVAGVEKGKTTNLRIEGHEGERLMNYNTCLAQRVVTDGIVSYIVNETKYSRSTSAIQSMVRGAIPSHMIDKTVTGIQMGDSSLN
jgi:hypothetical protein